MSNLTPEGLQMMIAIIGDDAYVIPSLWGLKATSDERAYEHVRMAYVMNGETAPAFGTDEMKDVAIDWVPELMAEMMAYGVSLGQNPIEILKCTLAWYENYVA